MKALVWHGKKDIRIEDKPEPVTNKGKVKVKVAWTGICGSDLHAYQHGIGVQVNTLHPISGQKAPLTLGHEFSGIVAEVGTDVYNVKPLDRVVIEPIISCNNCEACNDGKYNLCTNIGFIGMNADGAFSEYVIVDDYMVHKLPDNISLMEGALIEPTTVAVQAVKDSKLSIGDTVAVYGAGPIGLLTILAAKAAGASRIIAIDISEERLSLAREVGATNLINSSVDNPTYEIKSKYGNVDIAYEAAGVQQTLTSAEKVIKRNGEIMVISLYGKPAEVNLLSLVTKGANIKGSIGYHQMFPKVISLIRNGILDVKKVITSQISFSRVIEDGFDRLIKDKSQAKILVRIEEE